MFVDSANATEADRYKLSQIDFFDGEDAQFESTRPAGAPVLYGRLMHEKFSRSVASLGAITDRTVLSVCGGSGMDGEFLARAGARVLVADISLGAALRAQCRAKRHGLQLQAIVADTERLPLRDLAIDVCYVHDGLHHLANPVVGIREMARVAASALSINEPASAAITELAIRLGLALRQEEAGNQVARLDPASVTQILADESFRVVRRERYLMYYKHHPGWLMRGLSRSHLHDPAISALRALNRRVGFTGNKLTVQAVRR